MLVCVGAELQNPEITDRFVEYYVEMLACTECSAGL